MTTETPKSSSAGEIATALRLRVQLWVLIVFMAVGFAGGFLVRGLAHDNSNGTAPSLSDQQSGQLAPELTPEQLNAGTLPAGHPDVGAVTGATTTVPAQGGASTTTPTTTKP